MCAAERARAQIGRQEGVDLLKVTSKGQNDPRIGGTRRAIFPDLPHTYSVEGSHRLPHLQGINIVNALQMTVAAMKQDQAALINAPASSTTNEEYLRITAAIAEFERVLAQGEVPSLFRVRQVRRFSRHFSGRFAVAA